jgi:hypothetical protein
VKGEEECSAASPPLTLHYPYFYVAEPQKGDWFSGDSLFVIQKFAQCGLRDFHSAKNC